MRWIKLFEAHSAGDLWKQVLDRAYAFYQRNKHRTNRSLLDNFSAQVDGDYISLVIDDLHLDLLPGQGENGEHLAQAYDMDDESEDDMDPADPDNHPPSHTLTDAEFEDAKRKIQEMSDWVDEVDEANFGKSGSTVSGGGMKLNIDRQQALLDEFAHTIDNAVGIFGKSFEFDVFQFGMDGVRKMRVSAYDITAGYLNGGVYVNIYFTDESGEKYYIRITEGTSLREKFPSEEEIEEMDEPLIIYILRHPNDFLFMVKVEPEMTRKQSRGTSASAPHLRAIPGNPATRLMVQKVVQMLRDKPSGDARTPLLDFL